MHNGYKDAAKSDDPPQWKQHEQEVLEDLKAQNPSAEVGEQVTLVVEGTDAAGKSFRRRIRIDNLYKTENNTYQLIDAKHSSVNDLTKASPEQLRGTFTTNQKTVYDAIGGKDGATVTSVTPVGENASKAGLVPNRPINIEPKVNIGVNAPEGGIVYKGYP
ncbi:hypothetical protein [Capnocytophaga cynodegmi]|uniref:hypothetical protein n=1 Tax=Capnocytophaga cynodegmi TaxID=28189 RepID=UPI0038586823